MKLKGIIAVLLLTAASVQTTWAQKVLIYKADKSEIELMTSEIDSMVFVSEELTPMPSYLTCPDTHHPHAIDLGLPSGTKWCCCNVGTNSPYEKGGMYAWGETREKETYNEYTYEHCKATPGYVTEYFFIGNDIACTIYDVARVRMGMPWHMPSRKQVEELINNCSREWKWDWDTGVGGIYVTGSNGGKIFLHYTDPASGGNAAAGAYWTSSYNPSGGFDGGNAYAFRFINNSWTTWAIEPAASRECGLSVRAVCP